jgi:hypothetical protein
MRIHALVLVAALTPTLTRGQDGGREVVARSQREATWVNTAPPRQAIFARLLRTSRRAGSNLNHLRYLDLGLPAEHDPASLTRTPELLARQVLPRGAGERFPDRGELPQAGGELDFLHPMIRSACLVVSRGGADGDLRASWYGRRPYENDQWWSATKHLQALHVASALGHRAPGASLADLRLRRRRSSSAGLPATTLLRHIVSYSKGVQRSNAGAETFGRFFTRREREAWNVAHTGHPHSFRGAYGAAPLFAPPELVDEAGRVLLTGPTSQGAAGPNAISAYDLTRLTAMAAWHQRLRPAARLEGTNWQGVAPVLQAMAHDTARYVEVGLAQLGAESALRAVAVASKLGFGVRSKTGLPELTWVAAIHLEDAAGPVQAVLALKAAHSDAVVLDARVAAEVAEILRRLLGRSL